MNKQNQDIEMKKDSSLNFKWFVLFLFVSVTISSCETEEDYLFENTPIITGYLNAGQYFEVQINHQVPFSSEAEFVVEDLDNLSIELECNEDLYYLEPIGDGIYNDSSLVVEAGDDYTLSFFYNQKDISAYTYVPSKPNAISQSATQISIERIDSTSVPSFGSMPDPIEISWENEDESYYLLVVENLATELDPIRDFGDEDAPERHFRNAPTNSAAIDIRPNDFQYYGQHRIILYHVLPDYASLYEMSESNSQNITNPSTSITNGYGIFTGLNSDTLYINVKEG